MSLIPSTFINWNSSTIFLVLHLLFIQLYIYINVKTDIYLLGVIAQYYHYALREALVA